MLLLKSLQSNNLLNLLCLIHLIKNIGVLYFSVIVIVIALWHFDDVSPAHGADLELAEPLAEALLVEDVAAVGDLLQRLALLELAQADRAVVVLSQLTGKHHLLQHTHVSFNDIINLLCLILGFILEPLYPANPALLQDRKHNRYRYYQKNQASQTQRNCEEKQGFHIVLGFQNENWTADIIICVFILILILIILNISICILKVHYS